MEGKLPPRPNRKRPLFEDDFGDEETAKAPKQKKVRFPKGKKVRPGDKVVSQGDAEDGPCDLTNPLLAAKERAKHRNQITAELFNEEANYMSAAEVAYEDNEDFVDDGIQIEPFNLDKEREEGYFDAEGNFVEFVNENEFKDPWLDSVEIDPRYTGKSVKEAIREDDDTSNVQDLSSEDIGIIKRRIADLLEPGETVLRALRRLKGNSNKKEKMSTKTQLLFDQLTEDANKLLEHGEYNAYHEKQEVFKREAEGYERLALGRAKDASTSAGLVVFDQDIFADAPDHGASPSAIVPDSRNLDLHVSEVEISTDGPDAYDMFADDDDNADTKPSSDNNGLTVTSATANADTRSLPDATPETIATDNDYVYDETSGYYYSSSSGYYYDPSTGLYCHATTGQWYSFNQESNVYEEIHNSSSSLG